MDDEGDENDNGKNKFKKTKNDFWSKYDAYWAGLLAEKGNNRTTYEWKL